MLDKEILMRNKNKYAVLGLGRYGKYVAMELLKNGAEVIAVDIDEDIVNDVVHDIPICKCADITDPDVLEKLGLGNVDVAIIAMASNLEASVMATTLCKDIGIKKVIVKCMNEMHQRILTKVGADQVVLPEKESGLRLARNLLSSGFVDAVELSENISMIEMDVMKEWVGKSLIELNMRKRYGVNAIAINQNGKLNINIDPNMQLTEDMKLIVIADVKQIKKMTKSIHL
jgi:trk system potassium uptake protein TrkA